MVSRALSAVATSRVEVEAVVIVVARSQAKETRSSTGAERTDVEMHLIPSVKSWTIRQEERDLQ